MHKTHWLAAALAFLALPACNDGYGNNYPTGPHANAQVLHASPDAPELAVLIDGLVAVGELHYGGGTGEFPIPAGTHTVTIQALNPSGPTTVVGPTTINFQQNNDYVIEAEGAVAAISAQVYPHPLSQVAATSTRVQVVHAAPNAPSVSIYITAPGAALTSSTPFGTIAFMAAIGPTDIAAGSYEIRATPAGQTSPVLFDSGTVTLNGGDDLVLTALQNTGPGSAPVTLAVVDAFGDNGRLYDIATPANLRVVHDSPDAPALSVLANNNATSPLVPSLAYSSFTTYLSVVPNTYTFSVTPASNTGSVLVNQSVVLNAGRETTLVVIGKLAAISTLVTEDHRRRVATEAKLRIIQGSPTAGNVDVYLTAGGAGIASASPTYVGIPVGGDTSFQGFTAGSYDMTVTTSGSKTVVLGPTTINLINTGVYTAMARDNAGGGAPFGWILMDDFAP